MMNSPFIHPFLITIYPTLCLYAININKAVPFREVLQVTAISMLIIFLFFPFLRFVVKDKHRIGIIASSFALLTFSYGHVFNIINDWHVWGFDFSRNKYLLAAWAILYGLCVYLPLKISSKLIRQVTFLFNSIAACLIFITLLTGFTSLPGLFLQNNGKIDRLNMPSVLIEPYELPDIYYIVLDAYARADILKSIYHYDNSSFLDYLVTKGFFIADKACSNYAQTELSLASSLNTMYLNDLVEQMGENSPNRWPAVEMIRNNFVADFLRKYGYSIVVFSGAFGSSDRVKRDVIHMHPRWVLSEFKAAFLSTTIFRTILHTLGKHLGYSYEMQRKRHRYTFDNLAQMNHIGSPKLIFAHILAPHPPFVFGENGEPIRHNGQYTAVDGGRYFEEGEYVEKYRGQLAFLNKKLRQIIDEILSSSNKPPIIILQGDHGPAANVDMRNGINTDIRERMSILNAYYFPHNNYRSLYPEVSPVNTFRIVFNEYFGTNYELLPDESSFSTWAFPYKFTNVTSQIKIE